MNWSFDHAAQAHVLEDAGTQLARIFLKKTAAPANPFRVKTLISFLYYSPLTQKRLERSKKEWRVTCRRFHLREEAERYVTRKKDEIIRFIRSREA